MRARSGAMLRQRDAALIIGDTALFLDHDGARRATKIDLGEEWTAHDRAAVRLGVLGGRPDALTPTTSRRCSARATRVSPHPDAIAAAYYPAAPSAPGAWPGAICGIISGTASASARSSRAADVLSSYAAEARPRRRCRRRAAVLSMTTIRAISRTSSSCRRAARRAPRRSSCIATRRRRCSASWPTASARASIPSGVVTYIIDRNVNYTNVCVAKLQLLRVLPRRSDRRKATCSASTRCSGRSTRRSRVGGVPAAAAGRPQSRPAARRGTRICSAPSRQRYPAFKLHALSPPEVIHLSRLSQLPVPEVIDRLIAAGLDSIPGGGAEILVDRVRKLLQLLRQGDRRRVARRDAPRAPRRPAHDGDDDVRHRRDRRGAARAPAAAARRCRTRPAASPRSSPGATSPITPSSAAPKRPASTTCARWRSRASSSTTSTTCRRRG